MPTLAIEGSARDLPHALVLHQECQTIKTPKLIFFVTPSVTHVWRAGILTGCPSAAAFAIALGSPHPPSIFVAEETLDFRGPDFSSGLRLLMPTFSLPCTPEFLTDTPSPRKKCSPTTPRRNVGESASSVPRLAPVNFRRPYPRIVSCYTLFKGWLPLSQPPICRRIRTTFNT